ncbi:MAG: metal ABC transporter ATP-binding protein [Bacilli bacterium]|nr:metal ABC transporter ATP-binding protein [Bacilli bacterium]
MLQISCKNLCIGYDNKAVINNLNFDIESGDYIAIVGENGVGKSTLVKTLLGLIKPISGEIIIEDKLNNKRLGYLPQQSSSQYDFPASVWEVVISGCLSNAGLRPFYNAKEKEIALNNINKMGLQGMERKSYRNLSGGQKQRVLLARALCATKSMLLLDEPVSGLDPIVTKEMYELIESLNKEGITIIMISHDIHASIKYANKILHLGLDSYFATKDDYIKSDIARKFLFKGGCDND